MADLRTRKMAQIYKKVLEGRPLGGPCALCKAPALKSFRYWKIIQNEFPWDRIAKVNHLIVPKRHLQEEGLHEKERRELLLIKSTFIGEIYEFIGEATIKKKSIPNHFHLHLIIIKDRI